MHAKKFLMGMGLGIVLGVATGILLAPKSGRETREDLKDWAAQWQDKMSRGFKKVSRYGRNRGEEMIDTILGGYEKFNLSDDQREEIKDVLRNSFQQIKEIVKSEEE